MPADSAAICPLPHRAVIELTGADRVGFLQGLVSNDMTRVGPQRAVWAALLTPQGKFLFDLFVVAREAALWLDVEAARRDDLMARLKRHRLRAEVEINPSEAAVFAVWGAGTPAVLGLPDDPGAARPLAPAGVAFLDPRLPGAGGRLLGPPESTPAADLEGLAPTPIAEWEHHRLGLGLPDGSRDITPDKGLLMEHGFEPLNGVSFDKGCYMGQELTARTKHRGLVKKTLVPVDVDGPLPEPGTILLGRDGREAGEMKSGSGDRGLALLRIEHLGPGATFTAGQAGATLHPRTPPWPEA
ncbi:YgfZ/GcvT domain-containing protein [Roseospirillum parvum]|uniref:Uncharacterized protein n=1 Tax=Roseospirillum parvum TaxID=83401 RepID=A0A1G7U192_9PROT|nr:folate-binding protein YgfZ [Roseospirillum parvum]SDG41253.1 hypothetical protein SAMN05421742_101170 [Roseospirillum parvum]